MAKKVEHPSDCLGPLMQSVAVIVQCPVLVKSLDKRGIRSKAVKIAGVDWDRARWFCERCGWIEQGP